VLHFLRRLVQMHVNRDAQLGSIFAHLLQRRVGDGIGRMGCERGAQQRFVPECVVQFQPLVDVFVGAGGPGGGEVEHDQSQRCAHASFAHHLRGDIRKVIHVVKTGLAAADHLGTGQAHTTAAVVAADVGGFGGPDVMLQPVHQRAVVGQAAQQAHRRVGVGVDQPW